MKNEQENNIQNSLIGFVFSTSLIAVLLTVNTLNTLAVGHHFDASFSGDGWRTLSFAGNDYARDVAIQSDGKIIIAGTADAGVTTNSTDFVVVRLDPNGSLDSTFNGSGSVITSVVGDGTVNAVAIQPDGKIIVVGSGVVNGKQQFCLARYNTNGSLDTSFGLFGFVYTLFEPFATNNASEAMDIAIQPDGKIVAAGYVRGQTFDGLPRCDWAIVRYLANGSPDQTFDLEGILITDFGGHSVDEIAASVVIQPDGKILAGGASTANGVDFALARYNANGTPDTSLGGTGRIVTDATQTYEIKGIKLQTDGKIVAAGGYTTGFPQSHDIQLARYNASGSIDSTFGGAGTVRFGGGGSVEEIVIQPDGKIVGACPNGDFATFRLNPNGSFDAGYGTGGRLRSLMNDFDSADSIVIQPDGKLVAAGYSVNTGENDDFVVARFLPEMGKPFDFDNDGKTDVGIFRGAPGEWWINRSSNGATIALQFGASTDRIAPADFTGDGKTDIAFFRPSNGNWFVLRSEDFSFFAFPFGTVGDTPVPGDYDGDSKADAAVFRPSTLTWFIQKSGGGFDILGFGSPGDFPTVADYDGDGKTDIAIYRPNGATAGEWWVRRSSNASVFARQFGNSTDKPTQGDFTGDGKADIAFWRPSNGSWFVLRSEDSSFFSFPFGTNGDVPVPGDYDGDGKFDAGVFRPSNTVWYVSRSGGAGTLIQQFGIADDRPLPNAFVP